MDLFKNKKWKPVVAVIITMFSGVSVIFFLYALSYKPYKFAGNFNRQYRMKTLSVLHVTGNADKIMAISGVGDSVFYFQTKQPSTIVSMPFTLNDKKYLKLPIRDDKKISQRFRTYVDSNYAYIFAGNVPAFVSTDLNTKAVIANYNPDAIFTREACISPHSVILRGFEGAKAQDQVFLKIQTSMTKPMEKVSITGENRDFGFSTDGLLHYDRTTNQAVYTSFYNNIFYCLDTNLNLLYEGHTIDTNRTAQLKMGGISSGKVTTLTNTIPSRTINMESCVDHGRLYINSMIKADNEMADLSDNAVIDVYDLKTGKYLESFYIPKFKGEKIGRFKVFKDKVAVIYKSNIVVYWWN